MRFETKNLKREIFFLRYESKEASQQSKQKTNNKKTFLFHKEDGDDIDCDGNGDDNGDVNGESCHCLRWRWSSEATDSKFCYDSLLQIF